VSPPARRRRNSVLEALERCRSACDGAVSITHVLAFLYVCENEGLMVAELASVLRVTRATASRTARALASRETADSLPPYLGLVEVRSGEADQRVRALHVSAKGAELRDRIDEAIRKRRTIAPEALLPKAERAP
jgi:DNA-binding MarR family transcriptional regulator